MIFPILILKANAINNDSLLNGVTPFDYGRYPISPFSDFGLGERTTSGNAKYLIGQNN